MTFEMFIALICVFFLGLALGLAANLERIGRIARWRATIREPRSTTHEPRKTEATP